MSKWFLFPLFNSLIYSTKCLSTYYVLGTSLLFDDSSLGSYRWVTMLHSDKTERKAGVIRGVPGSLGSQKEASRKHPPTKKVWLELPWILTPQIICPYSLYKKQNLLKSRMRRKQRRNDKRVSQLSKDEGSRNGQMLFSQADVLGTQQKLY